MIKVDKNNIEIEGMGIDLQAELAVVVHTLHKMWSEKTSKESSEEVIMGAVKTGLKDDKEIRNEVLKKLMDLITEEDGEEDE